MSHKTMPDKTMPRETAPAENAPSENPPSDNPLVENPPADPANPKTVVVTEDGIPLPALPWSDNPQHVLAQRRNDEDFSKDVETFITMNNAYGFPKFCQVNKCKRQQKCCGAKRQTSGRRQGLYHAFPPCFEYLREPVGELIRGELKGA